MDVSTPHFISFPHLIYSINFHFCAPMFFSPWTMFIAYRYRNVCPTRQIMGLFLFHLYSLYKNEKKPPFYLSSLQCYNLDRYFHSLFPSFQRHWILVIYIWGEILPKLLKVDLKKNFKLIFTYWWINQLNCVVGRAAQWFTFSQRFFFFHVK